MPYEAIISPRFSPEGSPVIKVPGFPSSPSDFNPSLVRTEEIPHNTPGISVISGGNIDRTALNFSAEDGLTLQDEVSSDILQSYLDLVFTFRSAVIEVREFYGFAEPLSGLPTEWIKDHVADILDEFLTANPWAVVSAIVAAKARAEGIVEGFAYPEWGHYAAEGIQEGLSTMVRDLTIGNYLRFRRDINNPLVAGHLVYTQTHGDTGNGVWSAVVSGKVGLRFKTGAGRISVFDIGVAPPDGQLEQVIGFNDIPLPDLSVELPNFGDGYRGRLGEATDVQLKKIYNNMLTTMYRGINGNSHKFLTEAKYDAMHEALAAAEVNGNIGGESFKETYLTELVRAYFNADNFPSRRTADAAVALAFADDSYLYHVTERLGEAANDTFTRLYTEVFTSSSNTWAKYIRWLAFTPAASNTNPYS
jgi:hypothetical protein